MATSIARNNWSSSFNIVGKVNVGDKTFKIDQHSEKSNWVYSSMNLVLDCGEESGKSVYCEMMGGYSSDGENKIYCHGKNDDGSDDWSSRFEIAWDDRNDESVISDIGEGCFYTAGIERTSDGNVFRKKFLSQYDLINYVHEHLETEMVLNIRGSLKYRMYNGAVRVRKEIKSIYLSNAGEDRSKYHATFKQSILIDRDTLNLKENFDKATKTLIVPARVIEYLRKGDISEHPDFKGNYPLTQNFEFKFPDIADGEKIAGISKKLFGVKKGVTQMTWDGVISEGAAVKTVSVADLNDDIKELIEIGILTEEDALAKCADRSDRTLRLILKTPSFKKDENGGAYVDKAEEAYTEDDLMIDFGDEDEDGFMKADGDIDADWLNNLA